MSSQSTFSFSNSLVYQQPSKDVSGELNFLEFGPVSGSSFSAGQQFEINVASPDSFIDPSKTWLQYTLTATAGTTNASGALDANIGAVAVIKRVDSIVSGVEIESIDNYNHYYAMISKRQHRTYRDQLQPELEGQGKAFYSSADTTLASIVCNHALRIGLFEGQQKHIPVCFMRSGVNFRFTLDTSAYVSSATVSSWTVSDIRLVCGMLKPNPAYLQDFQGKLESGGSAVIPLQLVRNLNFVATTSTSQEAQLTCGYLKSLRSIMGAFRSASTAFNTDTRNNLTEFFFQNSTTRYPLNKTVKTSARNAENLMIALSSVDNTYAHMGCPSAITTATDHLVYYSFASNAEFGSGISVVDGSIRFSQVYSSAPTGHTFQCYATYDSKLIVSAGSVSLDSLNV